MISPHPALQAIAHGGFIPLEQPQKLLQRPRRNPGRIRHRLDALALQIAELTGHIRLQVSPVGDPAHAGIKLTQIRRQRRPDFQNRYGIHAHDLLSIKLTQKGHREAA